jgi:hypothetical protein
MLHELGYSPQANRKDKEGLSPPERDEQFHYINRQVKKFVSRGDPVISVDAKMSMTIRIRHKMPVSVDSLMSGWG